GTRSQDRRDRPADVDLSPRSGRQPRRGLEPDLTGRPARQSLAARSQSSFRAHSKARPAATTMRLTRRWRPRQRGRQNCRRRKGNIMAKALDKIDVGPRTLAIHAGEAPDPATGASSPNIVMSSTFVTDEPAGFSAYELTPESPFVYTRWANPTV